MSKLILLEWPGYLGSLSKIQHSPSDSDESFNSHACILNKWIRPQFVFSGLRSLWTIFRFASFPGVAREGIHRQ